MRSGRSYRLVVAPYVHLVPEADMKILRDGAARFLEPLEGASIPATARKVIRAEVEGDFVVWDKPVPETCPECGYIGAESKFTKTRGDYRRCLQCQNEWEVAPVAEAVPA